RRFSFLAFVAGVALPPMMPWFFFGLRRPSEIYALSLHDALPIYSDRRDLRERAWRLWTARGDMGGEHDNNEIIREILALRAERRSEEHTSELQSRENLVCRLLLEKKKPKEPATDADQGTTRRSGE